MINGVVSITVTEEEPDEEEPDEIPAYNDSRVLERYRLLEEQVLTQHPLVCVTKLSSVGCRLSCVGNMRTWRLTIKGLLAVKLSCG